MDLTVTGWVKKHQVTQSVRATVDTLDDVMLIPSCVFGEELFAYRADSVLGQPQMQLDPFTL